MTIVKLNSTSSSTIDPLTSTTNTQNTSVKSTATINQNGVATAVSTPSQITATGGHVVTIHTSSITSTATCGGGGVPSTTTTGNGSSVANGNVVSPNPPHTGYTRRAKLGDSRSTGRLHSAGNTHRSMTRLNIAGMTKFKCHFFRFKYLKPVFKVDL